MKIISRSFDTFLSTQAKRPCISFLTGPLRAIAAIAQCALNFIALLFLSMAQFCSKKAHRALLNTVVDFRSGTSHCILGVIETCPGTYFYFREKRKPEEEISSNINPQNILIVRHAIEAREEGGEYHLSCNQEEVDHIRSLFPNYEITYENPTFKWVKK